MLRRSKRVMMTLVWKPFKRQFGSQMDAFRKHQKQIEKDVSLSHMIEAADSRAMIRSDQLNLAKDRYGTFSHACLMSSILGRLLTFGSQMRNG